MTITELAVGSEEQTVYLSGGYSAVLRFDMIYKRWFFDLYAGEELLYAGISLTPDTYPLKDIADVSLAIVDWADDKLSYEPYAELGSRLGLMEVSK